VVGRREGTDAPDGRGDEGDGRWGRNAAGRNDAALASPGAPEVLAGLYFFPFPATICGSRCGTVAFGPGKHRRLRKISSKNNGQDSPVPWRRQGASLLSHRRG